MGGSGGGGGNTNIPDGIVQRWNEISSIGYNHLMQAGLSLEGVETYSHSPYLKPDKLHDYGNVETIPDPSDAFFGAGLTISSYPNLYTMFTQYISNVDASALYETILDKMINSPTIDLDVAAQTAYLNDEIEQTSLPKINAGMRDINAVMSTGFVYGKAFLESQKIKAVNKYSATLKTTAMNQVQARWTEELKWSASKYEVYAKLAQFYWLSYYDYVETNQEMRVKHKAWPFTLMDFQRSFVGSAAGAGGSAGAMPSRNQKAMSGALAGASAGAQTGSGWGTAIGAVVGAIAGYNS